MLSTEKVLSTLLLKLDDFLQIRLKITFDQNIASLAMLWIFTKKVARIEKIHE